MRTLISPVAALFLLAAAPFAHAQYYGQQQQQYGPPQQQYGQPGQPIPQQGGDQTILYNMKKNQPPSGMVIEQGNAPPGIPMSGVQQQQQLTPKANRRGPTTYYRDQKGLTVINGPDGTTVCRDVSGRVVVCN